MIIYASDITEHALQAVLIQEHFRKSLNSGKVKHLRAAGNGTQAS
jgi:hypothetical protein